MTIYTVTMEEITWYFKSLENARNFVASKENCILAQEMNKDYNQKESYCQQDVFGNTRYFYIGWMETED